MLEEHQRREDTIILAPAMHEGLDLKDDLARFQIITKVPYPSFVENKQLRYRMEIDNDYYKWIGGSILLGEILYYLDNGNPCYDRHDHCR